jgi:hypothetical protein
MHYQLSGIAGVFNTRERTAYGSGARSLNSSLPILEAKGES